MSAPYGLARALLQDSGLRISRKQENRQVQQNHASQGGEVAIPFTIEDIVEEYAAKIAAVDDVIAQFTKAADDTAAAFCVRGTFVSSIVSKPFINPNSAKKNLRVSAWRTAYNRLQIDRIASARDKKLFEQNMADPPEFTFENVLATFEDYMIDPRQNILRGLAEVFCDLDSAYKSHSRVAIGVKGLPKRVIMTNMDSFYGYGEERFRDMLNALRTMRGEPLLGYQELREIQESARPGGEDAHHKELGVRLRMFHNGNMHVFFDQWALLDINRALAEFYGEVLPDAYDKPAQPSQAVAKDLQYYWTPEKVTEKLLDRYSVREDDAVLEPSCGNGHMMLVLREAGVKNITGIEVHPTRANTARRAGFNVLNANFLTTVPEAKYDKVVMNPPFYGKHYELHIRHALKFLKPDGALLAVLPATARYDHKLLDDLKPDWMDLPVASFAAAGTNVATTCLRIWKR